MSDRNENLFLKSPPSVFRNARALRLNQTEAEEILWKHLRNKKMLGYKFRRQHPLGVFIADFYCHELSLVIEVDGSVHLTEENKDYDQSRERSMYLSGIKTIRFKNEDIMERVYDVVQIIRTTIEERAPLPPSPNGEGDD